MAHLGAALASLARVEHVVAETFGPHGPDQLLTDEANQATITNDGSVILSCAAPEDPLAALLLKLITDSCSATGDGCKRLLAMVLAGLRQFLRSGLHPLTFQAALAAQVLECVVPSAVLHVPLAPSYESEAAEAVRALIATHLGAKLGGAAAAAHLGQCLQELVLLQLEAAARAGISAAQALAGLSADPPLVRLPGAAPDQSRVMPGLVLREGPFGSGALPAMAALERGPVPFLALTCPLEGETIGIADTSSAKAAAGKMTSAMAAGQAVAAEGDQQRQQPAVAVLVTTAAEREQAQFELVAQLRRRLTAVASRGAKLLLLCGRPPDQAAQLCAEQGLVLVAGLEEQEVAQACAVGGTVPLARAGLAELAAAPMGWAAAARVIGLGGRRALLLEFDAAASASAQVARSLLVCGPTEAAVRQSARGLTRCLVSLSAAVGTMARPPAQSAAHEAAGGGTPGRQQEDEGPEGEDADTVECLVFVAGGGGFEGLLELQLRELLAVATRGPDAAAGEEEDEDEAAMGRGGEAAAAGQQAAAVQLSPAEAAAVGEAAAEEAASLSQLAGSLRVLHAMAAAVPLSLAGGRVGASGSGSEPTAINRRRQREALLQVHALRRAQAAALRHGLVSTGGLVVPAAAFSHCGRALRRTRAEAGHPAADRRPPGAADTSGPGDGQVGRSGMPTGEGEGREEGGAGRASASARGAEVAPAESGASRSGDRSGAGGDDGGVQWRPLLGGYDFAAADAVSHGVLEPAAVAAGLWSAAVEVLVQVLRIDGGALSAVRCSRSGGGGPRLQVAGAAPAAARARVRRGGRFGRAGGGDGGHRRSDSSSASSRNGRESGYSDSSSDD
ncbi:hypothetical protein HXX76_005503 [Chlamydomonas incerta]|uniref:Uncharacterized protein n=1 Tax=Chlamydomonas incerta TaxID=51695 RepID=A0A835TGK4_CHLIN|nr:hypothetical protein HXX76_005503 [Chlamydomonas incerta]|eukprot:KAG2437886.1 hypothetical protein HXX76_005503 [Chlamydomonas incerta]